MFYTSGKSAAIRKAILGLLAAAAFLPVDPMAGVGQNISDEWVEGRIKSAIMFNRHISIGDLDVEVDDGR